MNASGHVGVQSHDRPCARRRAILAASTTRRGRPNCLPFARAFLSPALTLSGRWQPRRLSASALYKERRRRLETLHRARHSRCVYSLAAVLGTNRGRRASNQVGH